MVINFHFATSSSADKINLFHKMVGKFAAAYDSVADIKALGAVFLNDETEFQKFKKWFYQDHQVTITRFTVRDNDGRFLINAIELDEDENLTKLLLTL